MESIVRNFVVEYFLLWYAYGLDEVLVQWIGIQDFLCYTEQRVGLMAFTTLIDLSIGQLLNSRGTIKPPCCCMALFWNL